MGSEHYCLRWNNHQSNLLGVFSQLLQDEALVDVTLACEGHSLRAHKVVLSACSAYFHGLFAAHPDRHPIVILQDAKFSELRTLVDFMYRGEVNVEYGRLSGLLRTAESLKVKGLAETTESNRGDPRCSRPSPTIHASTHEGEDASPSAAASPPMANPLPPDTPPSPPATTSERRSHLGRGEGSPRPATDSSPPGCHSPPRSKRSRGRHGSGGSGGSGTCEVRGGLACHRDVQGADVGDAVTAAEDVATPGVASPPPPSPPSGGPIPGPSGLLLPVQRVPLSLKKEMDWDRASSDDKSGTGESSSEYRHPQETETVGEQDGSQGPPKLFPCMYCGASFPHQSKLTRHILSHSLETLKYREQAHTPLLPPPTPPSAIEPLNLVDFRHPPPSPHPPPLTLLHPHPHLPPHPFHPMHPRDTLDPETASVTADVVDFGVTDEEELEDGSGGGGGIDGDLEGEGGVGGSQSNTVLCKFCGKSFADVTSLIGHLPVHTGDRPFK
ncbi:protein bric-a-brac 1-like isoform X3 [Ischnura elegans]|nr:protein bric-a-brac 1-like isoform X3 [Ischnura elegans]